MLTAKVNCIDFSALQVEADREKEPTYSTLEEEARSSPTRSAERSWPAGSSSGATQVNFELLGLFFNIAATALRGIKSIIQDQLLKENRPAMWIIGALHRVTKLYKPIAQFRAIE